MSSDGPTVYVVREAQCEDVAGIARVHVESWRTTYRGQIADDYLAGLSVEDRARFWRQLLCEAAEPGYVCVVEDAGGQIVGFVSAGPERGGHALYKGELYAIYLLQSHQRQGLGRKLFETAVEGLRSKGYATMLLWVLATNLPSRKFYEAMGGQYVTSQTIHIGGAPLVEIAYGWQLKDEG